MLAFGGQIKVRESTLVGLGGLTSKLFKEDLWDPGSLVYSQDCTEKPCLKVQKEEKEEEGNAEEEEEAELR